MVEFSFIGADYGYDKGIGAFCGRSLTVEQARDLDVLLVYEMNGQPLLAAARIAYQINRTLDGMVWHL